LTDFPAKRAASIVAIRGKRSSTEMEDDDSDSDIRILYLFARIAGLGRCGLMNEGMVYGTLSKILLASGEPSKSFMHTPNVSGN
jgi:hypothetical protein